MTQDTDMRHCCEGRRRWARSLPEEDEDDPPPPPAALALALALALTLALTLELAPLLFCV